VTTDEFPDLNGDGIPDAFENRRPVSEILNDDNPTQSTPINGPMNSGIEPPYKFYVVDGVVLLEVFGTSEVGACVFRSMAELREFADKISGVAREAFGKGN
jgi:hypothetical protein